MNKSEICDFKMALEGFTGEQNASITLWAQDNIHFKLWSDYKNIKRIWAATSEPSIFQKLPSNAMVEFISCDNSWAPRKFSVAGEYDETLAVHNLVIYCKNKFKTKPADVNEY